MAERINPNTITWETPQKEALETRGKQVVIRSGELGAEEKAATLPYAAPQARASLENVQEEIRNRRITAETALQQKFVGDMSYKKYDVVTSALAQALQTAPTPDGDIALTYAAAQIYDPDSVVRETEQETLSGTGSALDKVQQRIRKEFKLSEGGTYTPQARAALRQEIIKKTAMLNRSYTRLRRDFKKRAEDYGFDVNNVIGEHIGAPFLDVARSYDERRRQSGFKLAPLFGGKEQPPSAKTEEALPEQMVPGQGYIPPTVSSEYGGVKEVKIPQEAQDEAQAYITSQGKNITREGFSKALTDIFQKYGIQQVPTPESVDAVVKSVRAGKGYGGIEPRVRELTTGEKVSDVLLKNPVTGTIGGFGYGTTAGLLPEAIGLVSPQLQANAEETMRQAREVNPAIMGGEIAGNIAGSTGLAKIAAVPLKAAGAAEGAAPVLADVVFSGTQGAAEAEPGSRISGAGKGVALSLLGQAVPAATSRVLKPRPSEEVAFLREKGVELTPGQTIGGRAGRLEEIGSQLLLGGGDIAIASRRKAFDSFNREYLNEAGSRIGFKLPDKPLKPTERMKIMGQKFDEAYDQARSQMQFVADSDYMDGLTQFEQSLATDIYSPENAERLRKFFNNEVLRRSLKTNVTGDEYKSLTSLLGKRYRANIKTNPELANGYLELQKIVDEAAKRNSSAEAVEFMDNVDKGFAFLARAQEAGRMAGSRPGEFTPAQLMSVERRGDITTRGRAFNEGDTLSQQWAQSGQEVLGNVAPDSGTTQRLLFGAPLTGASTIDPTGLGYAANALLGLTNLPVIKQGVTALIAGKRPMPFDWLGGKMQEYGPALGRTSSAVTRTGERFLNAPPSEIILSPGASGPQAESRPSGVDVLQAAQSPEAITVTGGRPQIVDEDEENFILSDGTILPKSLAARPIPKAKGGKVSKRLACR